MKADIELVSITEINPAPYNPRKDLKPSDPEYQKLKRSITTFGYVELGVWNKRTKNLISGHQRLKILKELGITDVQVIVVDLSPTQEKALNIALNKIRGDWDEEKLYKILDELNHLPDFDLELTGFDFPEFSQLNDMYSDQKDGDDFDFGAVVESINEPVTQKGDLIELGDNRLLCGDSAVSDDLRLLMGSEKAAMLFTDPPYGISYYQGNRPNMSFRPKKCRKWETIYQDGLSEEEYQKWVEQVFTNMDNFLALGAPIYIFNAHKQFFGMYGILRKLKYHIGTVIVWAKPNFSISYGDYNPQVEFCAYGWKEDNGAHKWYGPTNETTLWEIKRDPTKDYQHLTQKPVAIPARAIRNSSLRGDIVLELFGGSGSTLIAAESLGRRCFCVEIDPIFCDGIVRRYINYIGKENVSKELLQKYLPEVNNAGK
ncbi:MAG: DNA modification methylase [Candidatus Omnitrophota bacterium]|jgi:DNA modification methylase